MSKWQSVNAPPPYDQAVLIRTVDGSIMQAFRTSRGYVTKHAGWVVQPGHWMPLPPPPRNNVSPAKTSPAKEKGLPE